MGSTWMNRGGSRDYFEEAWTVDAKACREDICENKMGG
jgi:hypothetical protein